MMKFEDKHGYYIQVKDSLTTSSRDIDCSCDCMWTTSKRKGTEMARW